MIKKQIQEKEVRDHLATLGDDGREVFLLHAGQVRATVIQGTKTINQMRANFELGVLETLVLGQAYLAAGILSSTVKGDDRVQLNIDCGGPIKGISVESWAFGAVRGYLHEVPLPVEKPLESFDLSDYYGPGFLSVIKLLEGKKSPFEGQIMLKHGDLAKDLAEYFLISEQTPTLVNLSIKFNKQGHVVGSGALFLQKLPGADDKYLEQLEEDVAKMDSLGKYLSTGKSGKEFVNEFFSDSDPQHLDSLLYGFSCPCDRRRYAEYLTTLPESEKSAILEEGPFPLELTCFNCGSVYQFNEDELQFLLK